MCRRLDLTFIMDHPALNNVGTVGKSFGNSVEIHCFICLALTQVQNEKAVVETTKQIEQFCSTAVCHLE